MKTATKTYTSKPVTQPR